MSKQKTEATLPEPLEIIKRLRIAKPRIGWDDAEGNPRDLLTDAADEIERLRRKLERIERYAVEQQAQMTAVTLGGILALIQGE